MAGQIWTVAAEGGYMYSDELSDYLRIKAQPLTKFRQFCDAGDGAEKGLGRGDKFFWDVYSDIGTQGRELDERQAIPESSFTVAQRSLTITEAGNSVPFTGKLMDLAKHDVQVIIDRTLKNDARKYFDIKAFNQFRSTVTRVVPTGGNSTTSVTVTTNSTASQTNNVALGTGHIKAISDYMKEANIPPFKDDDYMCISHPSTYRTFKNQLEGIKQYTAIGITEIYSGEIGRYENMRFVEQNFIPKGGANNATTFDPYSQTSQAWANGLSSWALFFGGDTVTEAIALPEEIRAKIPGDYGRSRGIAWYYLGGFGLAHPVAQDSRILLWDSAT
jgi:N4-gp56 family major capsid protein